MLTRNQAEAIALNTFAYSTIVNVGEVFIKDGLSNAVGFILNSVLLALIVYPWG
jgi:hypothetical protein